MDKTIENKFFEAFSPWGGVVGKCIYWMRKIYNMPEYFKPTTNGRIPESEDLKRLRAEILEATETFDDSVIMGDNSPLMDEIKANLFECTTDAQRDDYVYSLLMPFGTTSSGCGIADICNPIVEIKRCNESIKRLEKEIDDLPTDNVEQSVSPEQMKKALEKCIHDLEERIEWASEVCNKFGDILFNCIDADSVEYCLRHFILVMERYANRLDALLLTFGVDLMRVQRDCGVYLKDERLIDEISFYVGSRELTQKYIDALPKDPQPETAAPKAVLPEELTAPEATGYFEKLIGLKLMEISNGCYKWLGTKKELALAAELICEKIGITSKWKVFEALFNEKKLAQSKSKARDEGRFGPREKKIKAIFGEC